MEKDLNLQRFILSIVLVGIVLIIGIYITSEIGQVSKAVNTAGSVVNETVTGLTNSSGAGDFLSVYNLEDVSCSIGSVLNATSNATVPATNYTLVNCKIYATSGSPYTGANVKVSYTYTYTSSTAASNASENVTEALATGTSWISILVVVGFAVIILTMLTQGLGSAINKTEQSMPYY
jgi:hypothetical protein